jgi:hypothetical protein
MTDIHRLLGLVDLALAIALLATTAVAAALADRVPPTVRAWAVDGLALVVEVGIIIAAGVGPLLLATGHRPADPLHLVYAAVAVLSMPAALAVAMSRGSTGAARDRWLMVGALVLVGVSVRLLQTG